MTMLPEGENLFDFVDKNITHFMLETVYIGDRKDKAIKESFLYFRLSMVLKSPINIIGFVMILGSFFVAGPKIINQRFPAHACPDYNKVGKLIKNLKKDTNNLDKTFKQIGFNHKNGINNPHE